MTIWQASLFFVGYNNFGRMTPIYNLFTIKTPERKCSDFRILDQVGRIVDLCICLETTIGLANPKRVSESWATGGDICLNQGQIRSKNVLSFEEVFEIEQ